MLTVVAMVVGAGAGVAHAQAIEAPPPGFPAWCQGHRGLTETAYMALKPDLEGRVGQGYHGWFSVKTVRDLALSSCAWRNDAETQSIQAIYHQRRSELMKLAGLSDGEVDELLAAYLDQMKSVPVEDTFCAEDRDWDYRATPTRDSADARSRQHLACPEGQHDAGAYDWPDATEVQKVAADGECLAGLAEDFAGNPHTMAHGLRFVMCNVNASHLDAAKFLAEIKGWPGIPRTWAKINRALIMRGVAEAQADYRSLAAKDPAWKGFLFDEPEKATQAFMASYQAQQPLYDNLHAMIIAHGHSRAGKGKSCEADYWAPLVKIVAAKHPASADAVRDVMHDPATAMLAWGATLCAQAEGDRAFILGFGPPRGVGLSPKRVAFWAAITYANSQDDEAMHLSGNELGPIGPDSSDGVELDRWGPSDTAQAIIATVKPSGDKVHVTFKSEHWESPTFNCVETNKIDAISSDGKIIYRRNCTPSGVEKVTSTEDPIDVDARFAGALRPGRLLHFNKDTGAPVLVFASKDPKAALVGYFGFAW